MNERNVHGNKWYICYVVSNDIFSRSLNGWKRFNEIDAKQQQSTNGLCLCCLKDGRWKWCRREMNKKTTTTTTPNGKHKHKRWFCVRTASFRAFAMGIVGAIISSSLFADAVFFYSLRFFRFISACVSDGATHKTEIETNDCFVANSLNWYEFRSRVSEY